MLSLESYSLRFLPCKYVAWWKLVGIVWYIQALICSNSCDNVTNDNCYKSLPSRWLWFRETSVIHVHRQSMSSRLVLGHKSPESPAGKCPTYTILCPDLDYPKTLKELSAQKRLYVVNSAVHWWRHQWVRRKPFFAPCGHLVGWSGHGQKNKFRQLNGGKWTQHIQYMS